MKFQIRSHYWPNTPNLREIKVFIDDELMMSKFLSQSQILELAKQLRYLAQDLIHIGDDIED